MCSPRTCRPWPRRSWSRSPPRSRPTRVPWRAARGPSSAASRARWPSSSTSPAGARWRAARSPPTSAAERSAPAARWTRCLAPTAPARASPGGGWPRSGWRRAWPRRRSCCWPRPSSPTSTSSRPSPPRASRASRPSARASSSAAAARWPSCSWPRRAPDAGAVAAAADAAHWRLPATVAVAVWREEAALPRAGAASPPRTAPRRPVHSPRVPPPRRRMHPPPSLPADALSRVHPGTRLHCPRRTRA